MALVDEQMSALVVVVADAAVWLDPMPVSSCRRLCAFTFFSFVMRVAEEKKINKKLGKKQ